ncbi:hypothetical protein [Bradyrhizobium sp. 150]|uniref:hypothetical protein n=1 Tax=Bradyrhizobium sp. 150 TaxID=2782625 RepID=UPI001FF8278E|nr:hypothetical protein [Bradyrhizobium sp. 150]MCK1671049.1 hypothetical protein [Bradyrhizobium sp. 150]
MTIKVAIPIDVDADQVAEFATDALRHWGARSRTFHSLFHGLLILSMRTDSHEYLHNSDSEMIGKEVRK